MGNLETIQKITSYKMLNVFLNSVTIFESKGLAKLGKGLDVADSNQWVT